MYIAKILTTLRKTILDPQGKAVENSLKSLGYDKITDTRIGKFIELKINAGSKAEAEKIAEEACKKLLANPVMEDYTFEITEGES
ncbi:MAG: phosphoribosylformylglycinamidine synthase subunit PurS [Ignavibacteria bacterium]|jgi:phosphoribosylformylglycinamidine synthase subunit PurS|nr:phosphoribosylformylglycinamidine synthase subunit PurS [Ignavibacteria bacterium]